MFVQVIRGRVRDAAALRRQRDRWVEELRPGAEGFLGSTGGISEDGEYFTIARFESEDAARRNSARPEQGAWWEETARCLDGEATFADATEVDVLRGGGSDDAGFVQVMQGRVSDPARLRELDAEMEAQMGAMRPDLLGSLRAWHGDGSFTEVAYFTSEEDARRGEAAEPPPAAAAALEAWQALTESMTFIDLRDPWLTGP